MDRKEDEEKEDRGEEGQCVGWNAMSRAAAATEKEVEHHLRGLKEVGEDEG